MRFFKLSFVLILTFCVFITGGVVMAQSIFFDRFEDRNATDESEQPLPTGPAPRFTANLGGARVLQALDEGVTGTSGTNGVLRYRAASEPKSWFARMVARNTNDSPTNLVAVLSDGSSRLALDSDLPVNVLFSVMSPDGREVYLALTDQAIDDDPSDYSQIIAQEKCALFAISTETNAIRCVAPSLMVVPPNENVFNPRNEKALLFDNARGNRSWQGTVYFKATSFESNCNESNQCDLNRDFQENVYAVAWGESPAKLTTDLESLETFQVLGDNYLVMYGRDRAIQGNQLKLRSPSGEFLVVQNGDVSGLVNDDFGTIAFGTDNGLGFAQPAADGTFESTQMRLSDQDHQNNPGQLIVADDGVLYGFNNGELRRLLPYSRSVVARIERGSAQDWSSWWTAQWRTPIQIARGYALYVANVNLPGRGAVDVIKKVDLLTGETVTLLDDNPEEIRLNIYNWRLSGNILYFSARNNADSGNTVLGELDVLAIRNGSSATEALTLETVASAIGALVEVRDVEVVRPSVPVFDTGGRPIVQPSADKLDGKSLSLAFTKFMNRESVLDRISLSGPSEDSIPMMPFWLLQTLHLIPDPTGLDGTETGSLSKETEYTLSMASPIRDLWDWDLNFGDSRGLERDINSVAPRYTYSFETVGASNAVIGQVTLGEDWRETPSTSTGRNLINLAGLTNNQAIYLPSFELDLSSGLTNFEWQFAYDNHDFDENGSIVLMGEADRYIGVLLRQDHIVLRYFSEAGDLKTATAKLHASSAWNDRRGWHRIKIRKVGGDLQVFYAEDGGDWSPLDVLVGFEMTQTIPGVSLMLSSSSKVSAAPNDGCNSCTLILAGLKLQALSSGGASGAVLYDSDKVQTDGYGVLVEALNPGGVRLRERDPQALGFASALVGDVGRMDSRDVTTPSALTNAVQISQHDQQCSVPYLAEMPGFGDLSVENSIDDFTLSFWARLQPNSGFTIGDEGKDLIRLYQTHDEMTLSYLSKAGPMEELEAVGIDATAMDWYEISLNKVGESLSVSIRKQGSNTNLVFAKPGESPPNVLEMPASIDWTEPRVYVNGQWCVNPIFSQVKLVSTGPDPDVTIYDMSSEGFFGVARALVPVTVGRNFDSALSIVTTGEGTVSPSAPQIEYGDTVEFSLSPEPGNAITAISGCEGQLSDRVGEGTDNSRTYVVGPIVEGCSLEVTFAPAMVLADNGVTITCTGARVGDSGVIGGVTYTKRTRDEISQNRSLAASSCTSGITSMSYLFNGATTFNDDISHWDTSSVVTMEHMFNGANLFNQDIGSWDTGEVRNMDSMFRDAQQFNQDISGWDTSNLENMATMFGWANSFNQDISAWDTSKVTTMYQAFTNADRFNQSLNDWDTSNVTTMEDMFSYASLFNGEIGQWDTSSVTTMQNMFQSAVEFNQDISSWSTSNVVTMRRMFSNAVVFSQNIDTNGSSWDVSNVTDMEGMFSQAKNFNVSLNGWDTSKVTNMKQMFEGASGFNGNIADWNTSNVTNMEALFQWTENFNQDISNWDTSKVTNMSSTFDHSDTFNQDISEWDVGEVTIMRMMFRNARQFNQDIGGWDTAKVLNMTEMFQGADKFNQDLSGWCVVQFDSEPGRFDEFADAWANDPGSRPQWGQACSP